MASRERRVGSLGENDSGVLLPLYEGELNQLRQQLGDTLSSEYDHLLEAPSLTRQTQNQMKSFSSMHRYSYDATTS